MRTEVDGTVEYVGREQIVPGAVLRQMGLGFSLPTFSDSVVVEVTDDTVKLARPYVHVRVDKTAYTPLDTPHAPSPNSVESGIEFYSVSIDKIVNRSVTTRPVWTIVMLSTCLPASHLTCS